MINTENLNICKNNIDYVLNKNNLIKDKIYDPILDYPESSITMNLTHCYVDKLSANEIQNKSKILINTGGGLQHITLSGFIIKTIFDICSNIQILYKSMDYPQLKKNLINNNQQNAYLIHFAKRYKEFEDIDDKIIHIPYTDNSFDKTINNNINFNNKINKCYWRGGCDLNDNIRHKVCKLLKDSNYCDVKIYNSEYPNTKISTNMKNPQNELLKYKILLAIESVSSPSDVENILLLGAIPIIIYRWWKAWFYDYIENEVDLFLIHYDDLYKLPGLIENLCRNQELSINIVNNTKNFTERILNKEFITTHLKNQIKNLTPIPKLINMKRNKPTLGLAILTYNRPHILDQTLKSYKEKGFFEIFDEKIILIQDNLNETRKIAEKYDLAIYSTEKNIGIGPGNNYLLDKLTTDNFIICQDDFLLIDNNFKEEIFDKINLIESNIIDCYRLRNLKTPGDPMYSGKMHLKPQGNLPETNASGLLYFNFIENPEQKYPNIIKHNKEHNIYIMSSKNANYTENPVLYNRNWYIDNLYEFNKIGGIKAENNVQKFWEKQNYKIGLGNGIFMHCDKFN